MAPSTDHTDCVEPTGAFTNKGFLLSDLGSANTYTDSMEHVQLGTA